MLLDRDEAADGLRRGQSTDASAIGSLLRWLLFLTVAAYLLFAHGCHSDKDTELRTRFVAFASGKG